MPAVAVAGRRRLWGARARHPAVGAVAVALWKVRVLLPIATSVIDRAPFVETADPLVETAECIVDMTCAAAAVAAALAVASLAAAAAAAAAAAEAAAALAPRGPTAPRDPRARRGPLLLKARGERWLEFRPPKRLLIGPVAVAVAVVAVAVVAVATAVVAVTTSPRPQPAGVLRGPAGVLCVRRLATEGGGLAGPLWERSTPPPGAPGAGVGAVGRESARWGA